MKGITGLGAIVLLALAGRAASGDDWPAWRGPAGNGISAEKSAPLTWGPDKNVKWKVALPHAGNGSPIVSNGRVFVTCPEDAGGLKRSLYCFDRKDGKQLWVKTIDFGKRMKTHNTNPHSSSTPVADGKRVVVFHDAAGLACYDFEGKELWARDLGEFRHEWGYGNSPILFEDKVILNSGPGKRVFVAAFDLETGKTVWETPEPTEGDGDTNSNGLANAKGKTGYLGSWCTPVVIKVGNEDQILCAQPTRLVAYAPKDGKILWWCEGLKDPDGYLAYSSPVVAGDVVVYIGGFGGPGFGVRLGGQGNVTETHRLWHLPGNPQSIGSGVFLDGHIYVPFEPRLECRDPKTGKAVWQDRGTGGGGYWGSIVMAAGRCYVTNRQGATVVFKPTPERCEVLATNALGEPSNSTPAVSNGEIFIRTFKHLYCIAE
jgi:outer membrane protein assembly factor BamB